MPWALAVLRDIGTPAMMKILNGRLNRLYGYDAYTASGLATKLTGVNQG